jgi:SAM-dependent methyltransferase
MAMSRAEWVETWLEHRETNRKKIEKILKVFGFEQTPRDAAILDLGCGGGEALDYLKHRGYTDLLGVEPERRLVESNRNQRIIVGDCLDISWAGRREFDVVIMFGVLHHLHSLEEMKKTARNVSSLLKKGGYFYSVEPWKNMARTIVTRLVLETPLRSLSSSLRTDSKLVQEEKKELAYWLGVEKDFNRYATSIGLEICFYKRDLRIRYLIFRRS